MIKFENVEVFGWEAAIRGMRNPLNSWEKSDSFTTHNQNPETMNTAKFEFVVGENDIELMKKLSKAGTDHSKFLRMINVSADVTAPLYWWKEYDTYKVGTVTNSCSTMHTIHRKEFEFGDFSCEHLLRYDEVGWGEHAPTAALRTVIMCLNTYRQKYIETNDKKYWWQMIQLLPSSYNQRRTIQLNYEVLRNICKSRKKHKLDEWVEFCKWATSLKCFSEIIEEENKDD